MEYKQNKYDSFLDGTQEERYDSAFKRVRKIKGFYVHLLVYVIVNIGLIAMRARHFEAIDANFWTWQTLNTAFFWGIGLVAHAASVFGKDLFLSKEWEKRKLDQFLKEDDKKQQQWK
ncbi:MAG: 2TM domain-containing protein [Flavobacterium sp.]